MKQYKTVPVAPMVLTGVKGNDLYSQKTAEMSVSNITNVIKDMATQGWRYAHNIETTAVVYRKKGILEKLLGWIPIIGILFRSNKPDILETNYHVLVFEKDVD